MCGMGDGDWFEMKLLVREGSLFGIDANDRLFFWGGMSCGKWIAPQIVACSYQYVPTRPFFEAPAHRRWSRLVGADLVSRLS
jgi:hypothetical protein